MLHNRCDFLVGMKAKKNPYEDLLTAPFQMQRELIWFKVGKSLYQILNLCLSCILSNLYDVLHLYLCLVGNKGYDPAFL